MNRNVSRILGIAALAAVLFAAFRLLHSAPARRDPSVIYETLRTKAFTMTADSLGARPETNYGVYGAFMEIRRGRAVVTLASYLSGDAGLYFSTGGGMVGGTRHEKVRRAAARMTLEGGALLPEFRKAETVSEPADGEAVFYLRTRDDLFSARVPEEELRASRSPLAPLFFAAQDVITEFRLSSSNGNSAPAKAGKR